MIRRRLAAITLTAGLGLVSCGCLNLGHNNGNASCSTGFCNGSGSGGGGFFSFLHRHTNNNSTSAAIECCPTTDCPTCGVDGYDSGPLLQTVPPMQSAPQVIPVVPGTTLPSTSPPPRLVPTPTTSTQLPWSP